MKSSIFWVIFTFGALIVLSVFGYKAWQRSQTAASSKRSGRENSKDERSPIAQPQPGNPTNERTQLRPSHKVNPADAPTQLGQFRKIDAADDQTVPRHSSYLSDEQTQLRSSHRVEPVDERMQLGYSQDIDEDEPTQIKRDRTNKVEPDDDPTTF
jgi:hypothetical protein